MPSIKEEDVQLERSSKRSLKKSRSKICKFTYANPYLNFLWEFRELPENKTVPLKQLFKVAGTKWKKLSLEERKPYLDAAKGALDADGTQSKENNHKASKSKAKVRSLSKKIVNKRKTQQPTSKSRTAKQMKMSSACSNCGHRHGSRENSTVKRRKYSIHEAFDSKSRSSDSQSSDDSISNTKSEDSRSQTKTTLFETDVSSISTF